MNTPEQDTFSQLLTAHRVSPHSYGHIFAGCVLASDGLPPPPHSIRARRRTLRRALRLNIVMSCVLGLTDLIGNVSIISE